MEAIDILSEHDVLATNVAKLNFESGKCEVRCARLRLADECSRRFNVTKSRVWIARREIRVGVDDSDSGARAAIRRDAARRRNASACEHDDFLIGASQQHGQRS